MPRHESIHYIEFHCQDLARTKEFFEGCFGWTFVDYGPDYTAFSTDEIEGGFFKSDQFAHSRSGSVLIVLYSDDLESTQAKIERAGGKITQPIFSFPGGRRFHFCEPSGNELAVWSTPEE